MYFIYIYFRDNIFIYSKESISKEECIISIEKIIYIYKQSMQQTFIDKKFLILIQMTLF